MLEKEQKRNENNKIMNRPVVVISYAFALIFFAMIGYLVYFMMVDSTGVIANSANKRQDSFADKVVRGSIITSDGEVIAQTKVSKSGEETRDYPHDEMFSHVVGYTKYGKNGLELEGNYYLLTSTANIFERVYNTLKEEKNIGDNVISTLDFDMQEAAYKALKNVQGAIVVMEPDTGKILALVSKPDFNPNEIDKVWEKATQEGSEDSMLLNRATQGRYAPGSTFKILTVLEYIRENRDYTSYEYDCESEGVFNSVSIHCAKGQSHGKVTLADTLAQSCNTSVANIGTKINIQKLHGLCEDFLFNKELPINGVYNKSSYTLTGESKNYDVPQTVIGQGDTTISPLHNAMIISAIANGGILMKPYLIDSIENYAGARIKKFTSSSYGRIITSEEATLLSEMLEDVVKDGTATKYLGDCEYSVAGKTGTAEYGNDGNVNSWFIGYSNVENPDIVVSILIEDSDTVGVKAAKVARKLFDAYYKDK